MIRSTRRQFVKGSLAVTTAAITLPVGRVLGASERVNLGVIGLGGRGSGHCGWFGGIKNVSITHVAEPEAGRLQSNVNKLQKKKEHKDVKGHADMRKMLEDKDLNAVVIATCNHWHCLAAVWAVQAGKDVYVEKPMGHNNFEELHLIAEAEKHKRIVQLGTQQRSDPVQAELKEYLHKTKELGEVQFIRANRYGPRGAIGKRKTPLKIPKNIDYDLWLGPALEEPLFRNRLQYDWHWDFNTGNGEMGNWGVHILDDVRNVGLLDKGGLPKRIIAGGGRVAYNDAGDTPNVHFAYYETDTVPVLFDLSNLNTEPGKRQGRIYKVTRSGYTVHCEGGYYSGGRGGGTAFDNDGKRVRRFKGDGGGKHAQNFIDAVRSRDRSSLNADVVVGHHSSAWCNLANVGFQVGGKYSREQVMEVNTAKKEWGELIDGVREHLAKHNIDINSKEIKLSPMLEIDRKKEQFVGPTGKEANQYLKRTYRKKEYAFPANV